MSGFRAESQREAARHGHGCLQTLEGTIQNVPHGSQGSLGSVADFIFGGSKITADGDCSHEIKRC